MKALTEESEKPGIESKKSDLASVEKNTMKKKVKIVKKIVKRKVIIKVPKRVSVASHCNDLEKVASPNPNDNSPMEIEKTNVVVNELKEVEDMKEIEVSDRDKDIRLVENSDCSRNESEKERSGLVTTSLLVDQNRIEHDINNMDVEEHAGGDIVKEHDVRSEDTKVDESMKEHDERSECDGVKLQGGLSNGVRGEDDMKEQIEKREDIDLKLSDAVEGQEGMKEVVNSETDGLKLQEGSSEIQVASRLHMKNRMKIFIHGLDKETNEEDIREVFEEVGEVVQVKLIRNFRSGKSRGCGFIRYASADLARLALKKYNNVEICGKLCHTAAVDGSDTILLNNIDKNWNNEHVLTLLQKIGIKNIDEVSVVSDPKNPKLNLGFAYLELETKRDAQIVFRKLQNKNIFGTHSNIKVTWADPLADPVEEEIHNNNNYNYNYNNNYNNGVKVSLRKSIPKVKPITTAISGSTVTEVKQKTYLRPHKPQNMKISSISRHEDSRKKEESSTTDELVRLLREQASWKHGGPSLTTGMNPGHHHQPPFGGKQPFTQQLGSKSLYHDPRAYQQTHPQIPNAPHPRSTANGVALPSFGHFDQQHAHYSSTGSSNFVGANPRYFQSRDQARYHGSSSSIYRRMR